MPGPRGDPDRGNPSRGTVRPPGHRGLSRHGHRRRRCRGHLMTPMLEVKDLKVAYGKILAVKKISFSVEEGQVVTLIGTNGAGKTTTLRTISGLIRPASGEILFQGKRIDTVPAHQIVSMGLAPPPLPADPAAALDALACAVRDEPEGNRNALLYWAACRALDEGIRADIAAEVLSRAALAAGLSRAETDGE